MIEVRDMFETDIKELLKRVGYGHFACSRRGAPYVVPIHYAFEDPYIYIYTTEGKKSSIIRENPQVCLQVEEIVDNENWKSVIVEGEAGELTEKAEQDQALELISNVNPTLTPALSIRWMDSWVRENISVFYRIVPVIMTGRESVPGSAVRRPFTQKQRSGPPDIM